MIRIGIIGKPNAGKSTFFSALTGISAQIADYPFTTIKANIGMAYARKRCPHTEFGKECTPRNAPCLEGTRMLPIELIDVAGLVPGAHEGRGLGNRFLDELRQADGFIQIVDASGTSDFEGNKTTSHDPLKDVEFLREEMNRWLAGILQEGWQKAIKMVEIEGESIEREISSKVTGLGISESVVLRVVRNFEGKKPGDWSEKDFITLADSLWRESKPMVIAANKCDLATDDTIERLKKAGFRIFPTSAIAELTLQKARESGAVDYKNFNIKTTNERQKRGLEYIRKNVIDHFGTTGLQECFEHLIFEELGMICVYPVENENELCDKDGRVLPDAYLIRNGTTARDLAYIVHTDLGEGFIRAIDCRTKRVVGSDHLLKDGDVIKIVARR